jgi:hypothetical protein
MPFAAESFTLKLEMAVKLRTPLACLKLPEAPARLPIGAGPPSSDDVGFSRSHDSPG